MEIHQKIPIIMSEIGAIQKAKKNAQQGFMYRGVDDVMNALQPLLHKHGVFIVPEVLEQKREERQTNKGGNLIYSVCTIKYTFYASDGSFITAVVVGEGMDSGDKATNKAMAIAFKYACFQVFCIPTEEMKDPDADTPEPSMPKESAKSKQEPELFICRDCGEVIKPFKASSGKTYGVRELAARSEKKYGRPLCVACAEKVANESTDN
jgi:hypothetical protein